MMEVDIGDPVGGGRMPGQTRHWRLNGRAMEKKLGGEDDSRDLASWDWR